MADSLRDLDLGDDGEVSVGADGDLRLTDGLDTLSQALRIRGSEVLTPLLGEPVSSKRFEQIQARLADAIDGYPLIDDVSRVSITEVNRTDGTISVIVHTQYNNSYEIPVTVTGGDV